MRKTWMQEQEEEACQEEEGCKEEEGREEEVGGASPPP